MGMLWGSRTGQERLCLALRCPAFMDEPGDRRLSGHRVGLRPPGPRRDGARPRKVSEPILSSRFALQLSLVSLTIAAAALTACHFGLRQGPDGSTMTLTILVVMQLCQGPGDPVPVPYRPFSNPGWCSLWPVPWLYSCALFISRPLQKSLRHRFFREDGVGSNPRGHVSGLVLNQRDEQALQKPLENSFKIIDTALGLCDNNDVSQF